MAKRMIMGCSMLVLGLAIFGLIGSPVDADAISCTDAITKLLPCQNFLLGSDGITAPCCQAAAELNQKHTATRDERVSLCQCFERVAPAMGINYDNAKKLPDLCNIKTPVPIDLSVDCNKL